MSLVLVFPYSLIFGLVLVCLMLAGFLHGGKFRWETFRGLVLWRDQLKKFGTEPFWHKCWRSWRVAKAVHLGAFGILGCLLAGAFLGYGCWDKLGLVIFALACGVLFGFVTEYLQACFARGASWWDVGLNAVSVLGGGVAAWVSLCTFRMMSGVW